MKSIKWSKLNEPIKTLVLLVGGVLLIAFSFVNAQTLTYALGALVAVSGLAQLVVFFAASKPTRFSHGLFLLCAGLFLFFRPDLFGALLPYLFTFGVLLSSCVELEKGLSLRKAKAPDAPVRLIAGGIVFAFAVILMVVPFASRTTNYILIGVGYALAGVSSVVAWIVKKVRKPSAARAEA